VRLRVTASERERWTSAAWEARETLSELVRTSVERELERRRRRDELEEEAAPSALDRIAAMHEDLVARPQARQQ
jgi:hypothetical protein